MNKLFTKIAKSLLGLSMAVGVGVAVGSNVKKAGPVNAAIDTYTFTSKSWAATPTNWISDKDGGQLSPGRGVQVTAGASGAGAHSSSTFSNVSQIVVTYSTNSSKGAGSISMQVGTNTADSKSVTKTGGTTDRTLTWDYPTNQTGTISFSVTCTQNSIYVKSIAITTVSQSPEIIFSKESISGEENDPFSFTWTESNLTSAITWSPASDSTNIIDYNVDTSTKTVSGTLKTAGQVTLTATSGTASDSITFNVTVHETNRLYTVTSTSSVSESGDTITDASASYSQTYGTAKQATAGNSMTLLITGLSKKVTISKLVLSMKSNSSSGSGSVSIKVDGGTPDFIAGTSSSSGLGFDTFGDNTTYGSTYRNVTWDNLEYVAKSSIEINVYCSTNSIYCESYDIFFEEEDNLDVVTSLSVSPNSWTGYDSEVISVSDYTVSVVKNGSSGTSADYEFQGIGSGAGDNFIARDANFVSGYPITSDERLQWKAKYPTSVGGSTFLYAYVSLNVTADEISTISLSGSMPTDYSIGNSWSSTGLVVTANYLSGNSNPLSENITFNYYSDSALTNELADPEALGVGPNQTIYVKATYSGVTPNKVSSGYPQTVSVSKEPNVVLFGTGTGAISMSGGSGNGTDSFGNSVTASCNSDAYQSNQAEYSQVGSKNSPLSSWVITISFEELVGLESFEIKFKGSGGSSNATYTAVAHHNTLGDETIINGGVDGQTDIIDSTDSNFVTTNANSIVVTFTGSSYGVCLYYISYVLGNTVQEFGTLSSISISENSMHNTIFKVGDEFSTVGLIIIATDTVGFTKEYSNGFVTDFDGYGNFTDSDVGTGISNTVSLTLNGVTKTTAYTFDVIDKPTYSLISSQDALYEGMKIIIYGSDNKALGSENSSGYFNEEAVVFDSDVISDAGNSLEFTVRLYGNSSFALQSGGKYLQYHGSSNNAYLNAILDNNSLWTFDSTDGLVNVGETTRTLKHNSSATRFACYTSGMVNVSLYLSSATPKDDVMGAATYAQKYLHMRDYTEADGSCMNNSANHYYSTAKAFYNDSTLFSNAEKVEFAKDSNAVARLQAWASANGETFDENAKTFAQKSNIVVLTNLASDNFNATVVIVIMSMISITALSGYFFIKRRKEQN